MHIYGGGVPRGISREGAFVYIYSYRWMYIKVYI